MKNKEFIEDLDKINQGHWEDLKNMIKNTKTKIYSITFETLLSDELFEKYELNNDIKIMVVAKPDYSDCLYYYKGLEVKPDCYYIRPDKYFNVNTLEILQECISQDKHNPDIKAIEDGTRIRHKKLDRIVNE